MGTRSRRTRDSEDEARSASSRWRKHQVSAERIEPQRKKVRVSDSCAAAPARAELLDPVPLSRRGALKSSCKSNVARSGFVHEVRAPNSVKGARITVTLSVLGQSRASAFRTRMCSRSIWSGLGLGVGGVERG